MRSRRGSSRKKGEGGRGGETGKEGEKEEAKIIKYDVQRGSDKKKQYK